MGRAAGALAIADAASARTTAAPSSFDGDSHTPDNQRHADEPLAPDERASQARSALALAGTRQG